MNEVRKFKPSLSAPLPYKGAPLDVHDMIAETIRKEDPLVRPGTDVVVEIPKRTVPTHTWNDTAKHVFGHQIIRFTISLARP
jgi:hypothetical protein